MADESIAFDRAADFYDETRGFPAGVEPHVAELIASAGSLNVDKRILEIGVGTGRIALPVSAHVKAYFGIDLSLQMMNRLRYKRRSEPVHVAQADATQLPFAAGVFDAVIAVHVFHLIANWRQVLAELKRVLRPGAPMLICWSGGSDALSKPLWDAWNAVIPSERSAPIGTHPEDDPAWAVAEGWVPSGAARCYEYQEEFVPRKHVEQLRRRVWSRLWRLSDAELQAGVAAVEAAVEKYYDDPTASISQVERFCVQAYVPRSIETSVEPEP